MSERVSCPPWKRVPIEDVAICIIHAGVVVPIPVNPFESMVILLFAASVPPVRKLIVVAIEEDAVAKSKFASLE